jgi:hypothetical protein
MQSAARYLKVDVSELPKVVATCRILAATLRQMEGQARQGWQAGSKSGNPKCTKVHCF